MPAGRAGGAREADRVEAGRPDLGAAAAAKPYAGKTITAWLTSHVYANTIKGLLADFEERSGMKVTLELLAFDIHNQRADLELSSGSGSVDVMNLTFIFSGKWIKDGWLQIWRHLLTTTFHDEARRGRAQRLHRRCDHAVQARQQSVRPTLGRRDDDADVPNDVFKDKGVAGPPKTFDEMVEIAKKVHAGELAGNLTRGTNGLHWVWPTYLYGYGGKVLTNPPQDMTPALNSKESVAATTAFDQLQPGTGCQAQWRFRTPTPRTAFNRAGRRCSSTRSACWARRSIRRRVRSPIRSRSRCRRRAYGGFKPTRSPPTRSSSPRA